jgi:hypothetical protein
MEEWRYSSSILNLDIRQELVVSFTPLPLHPWETTHTTHFAGDWVKFRREKEIFVLTGNRTPTPRSSRP